MIRNLNEIELEYITGTMTLAELAIAHGMQPRALDRASSAGGWRRKRIAHRTPIPRTDALPTEPVLSPEYESWLRAVLDATDRLEQTILAALRDPDQLYRYFVPETDDEGRTTYTDRTSAKLDTRALRDCANTLKDILAIKLCVGRVPTLRDEREQARLLLQQQKLYREDASPVTLTLDPEVEALLPPDEVAP